MVAAGFAVADWIALARGARRLEFACKPAALLALILVALTLTPALPEQRSWFVVALGFGLVGDIFLMLPQDRFIPGLAAFMVGHLAYVAGFATAGGRACAVLPTACTILSPSLVRGLSVAAVTVLVLGLGLPLMVRILRGAARIHQPGLVAGVATYTLVISLMLASATMSGNLLAAAGAMLFFASDGLIGWSRFAEPVPGGRVAIIVTYHLGQALLVLSLLGAV